MVPRLPFVRITALALLALLCAGVCCPAGAAAPPTTAPSPRPRSRLGVLFTESTYLPQLTDAQIEAVGRLGATAELLAYPERVPPADQPYTFAHLRPLYSRFVNRGVPVIAGVTLFYFPGMKSERLVNSLGKAAPERPDIFSPTARAEMVRYLKAAGQALDREPGVAGIWLLPPGYFGEAEVYAGEWDNHTLYAYSRSAKDSFRRWLQRAYQDLPSLNRAWGTSYAAWNNVDAPLPKKGEGLDTRRQWSDFMHWFAGHFRDAVDEWLAALRSGTKKPVGLKVATGKNKAFLGTNIGLLVPAAARSAPFWLDDTNGHNLVDLVYTRSASRFWNGALVWAENDYARFSGPELQKLMLNGLFAGVDRLHFAQHLRLFDAKGLPTETYGHLQQIARVQDRLRPGPPPRPVAFFHSALTSWYRGPRYENWDVPRVYDAEFTTRPAVASWGRALGRPDVVDDWMIASGALERYQALVLPAGGPVLTSTSAMSRLRKWVEGGGLLIAQGPQTLTWLVGEDREVAWLGASPGRWLAGMSGVLAAGKVEPLVATTAGGPPWTREIGATTARLAAPPITRWAATAMPVLKDGQGRALVIENRIGRGRVLFCSAPLPEPIRTADPFWTIQWPRLMAAFLASGGVRPEVAATAGIAVWTRPAGSPATIVAFPPLSPWSEMTLSVRPDLAGKGRIALFGLDTGSVAATGSSGSARTAVGALQPVSFVDPTNTTTAQPTGPLSPTYLDFPLPSRVTISPTASSLPRRNAIAPGRTTGTRATTATAPVDGARRPSSAAGVPTRIVAPVAPRIAGPARSPARQESLTRRIDRVRREQARTGGTAAEVTRRPPHGASRGAPSRSGSSSTSPAPGTRRTAPKSPAKPASRNSSPAATASARPTNPAAKASRPSSASGGRGASGKASTPDREGARRSSTSTSRPPRKPGTADRTRRRREGAVEGRGESRRQTRSRE
jgi:hypothetical protein